LHRTASPPQTKGTRKTTHFLKIPKNILNFPESSTCFSAGSPDAVLGVADVSGVAPTLASKDDAEDVVAMGAAIYLEMFKYRSRKNIVFAVRLGAGQLSSTVVEGIDGRAGFNDG
jgi:hypothetical protein